MLQRGRSSRGCVRGRRLANITYSYDTRAEAASAQQFFNKFYAIFRLRVC